MIKRSKRWLYTPRAQILRKVYAPQNTVQTEPSQNDAAGTITQERGTQERAAEQKPLMGCTDHQKSIFSHRWIKLKGSCNDSGGRSGDVPWPP